MARRRYLKPGVVRLTAVVTVGLAVLRAVHLLVPSWWAVGFPAGAVVCAYVAARLDTWYAGRAVNRDARDGGA